MQRARVLLGALISLFGVASRPSATGVEMGRRVATTQTASTTPTLTKVWDLSSRLDWEEHPLGLLGEVV